MTIRNLIASAFIALIAIVGFSASANAKSLPAPKCVMGVKYNRATNADLKKFGLMTVCDGQFGAVNVKTLDDVSLTSRPGNGPLYYAGCVLTHNAYVKKGSVKGCRVGVLSYEVSGDSITFKTAKGDYVYK